MSHRMRDPALPARRTTAFLRAVAALVCLAACSAAAVLAAAQAPRVPALQILDRIPADTPADSAELRAALLALTGGDLATLCGLVLEPGRGDDSRARTAVHTLAQLAGGPDGGALRQRLLPVLQHYLVDEGPPSVKEFLLEQWKFAGTDEAAATLAPLLHDERLCQAAASALVAVGGEASATVLRQALKGASEAQIAVLLPALGAVRHAEAVDPLLTLAQSPDPELRVAALEALASIGDSTSIQVVMPLLLGSSHEERIARGPLLLKYAGLLAQSDGQSARKLAARTARLLLDDARRAKRSELASAALACLVDADGDRALDEVLSALGSDDDETRAAAIEQAVRLPSPEATQALSEHLAKGRPAARTALLEVLSRRGDETAFSAAAACLADPEPDVQAAAIQCVLRLGGPRCIAPLAALLATATGPTRAAAQDALVGLSGAAIDAAIGKHVESAPGPARAALIEVLARRGARDELARHAAALDDPDVEVRIAMIRATAGAAGAPGLAPLAGRLANVFDERERAALEDALTAICLRCNAASVAAAGLVDLETAAPVVAASALRIMGRVGGAESFAVIRRATQSAKPEVRDAAYRSLELLPSAGAARDVLELARSATELNHHVLAFRAFVRLAGMLERVPAADQLRLLTEALDATRRTDERKLVLPRVGELATHEAVGVLMPLLADTELKNEAAAALLTACERRLPAERSDVRATLERIRGIELTGELGARRERVAQRLRELESFVLDWFVCGPFEAAGKQGNELLDEVFAPESSPADAPWRHPPRPSDGERYWFIDLNAAGGGDNRAMYLFTRVRSPTAREVRLELGSDDGIKVWLNGALIHSHAAYRGCQPGDDKVDAQLRAEWNEILIKVANGGGGFGACLRICDRDGRPLDDLEVVPARSR